MRAEQRLRLGGVEAGGRLVEQQQAGAAHQAAADLHPPLGAEVEVADQLVPVVGDVEELGHRPGHLLRPPLPGPGPGQADHGLHHVAGNHEVGPGHQVVADGEVEVDPAGLERAGHAEGRPVPGRCLADVLDRRGDTVPESGTRSPLRTSNSVDLPGTVRPDEADQLAGRHGDRHVAQGLAGRRRPPRCPRPPARRRRRPAGAGTPRAPPAPGRRPLRVAAGDRGTSTSPRPAGPWS